ncbi:MAG: ATP-binding protein, partial [Steroidobacteraceae bacterium]
RFECRMRHHDGQWRWMVTTAVPLFEEQGEKFSGYVGSCLDISEMRRAASDRESLLDAERAARSEAERLSHMKDEFLATLSHELRTPLNAVLGWTVLLRRQAPGSNQFVKGLETIERNARAQAKIIEDLLDMSRIVSGKVQLDVGPVDVAEVVRAAVEAIKPTAEAKRLYLTADYGAGVSLVQGDANRLQQVLWNLLTNAAKFTPAGGRIDVGVVRVDSHVEIRVTDSGIGIDPEFLGHAFDRFRQADASITRGHDGLGLGLAIVKNLVELHGGVVRALSDGKGMGSTFIVSLPLSTDAASADGAQADLSESTAELPSLELPSLAGTTVLVVDDQRDARELIGGLITDRRGKVLLAGSANEALAVLVRENVDVLVSDIGMPNVDGYALIRLVRALPAGMRDIPSIAVTAYARTDDRRRALQAGYQMHLTKPVEPRELITGIAGLAHRIA